MHFHRESKSHLSPFTITPKRSRSWCHIISACKALETLSKQRLALSDHCVIASDKSGVIYVEAKSEDLEGSCSCSVLVFPFLALTFQFFSSEAIAAINGTIAFGLERHPSRQAAFGTIDFSGTAWIFSIALNTHQNTTVRAAFRFVDKPFGTEEFLLACRKYKRFAAIPTRKVFILKYHGEIPTKNSTRLRCISTLNLRPHNRRSIRNEIVYTSTLPCYHVKRNSGCTRHLSI